MDKGDSRLSFEGLLSVVQVRRMAGVSKGAVIKWETAGKLTSVRVGGNRARLFAAAEVEAFLKTWHRPTRRRPKTETRRIV